MESNNDGAATSSANPFTLPSDEEVFHMRDDVKRRKEEDRERNAKLKIHEKITNSSKRGNIRRFKFDDSAPDLLTVTQSKQTRGLVAAATAAISSDRRREKENMADFIAKKREMFLVQMSLDTKREEIRKLEEKAQLKEEALKKSELMLEEDAVRFDTFLKENDKKAHEAIKKAEKETKAKADRVQEIKKLNQQIQLVQSDMSKLKEQLDDCLKYKAFLDELTPPEWEAEQLEKKKKRQADRLRKKRAKATAEWEAIRARAIAEQEERDRAAERALEKDGKVKKKAEKPKAPLAVPPMPALDDLVATSSGEELPMYFQHPQQLLDIFTALEESNLFLIQNSQETEQSLEELKQNYRETKKKMNKKTQLLKQNIDELKEQIHGEDEKANHLRQRAQAGTGENVQERMLQELHDKVLEVYQRCGFEADSNPNTLFMLTDLEARLEDLLSAIEHMPEDYVIKAEKEKEKERRERVRQERIAQQTKMYEERMKKSMERSMQAPKKRKGRQVMWRSQPQRQIKQQENENLVNDDDQADQQHFRCAIEEMPTFRNDLRNVGGRDGIYDEKVNHQLKLLSINPTAGFTTRPPVSPLSRLRNQRRQQPRNTTPTAFAKRLSRNRLSQEPHETREHLQNIKVMMKKILSYDAKRPAFDPKPPRPPDRPDEMHLALRNGFSLPRAVRTAVDAEAQRRLLVAKQVHVEPENRVGVRSLQSPARVKPLHAISPRPKSSSCPSPCRHLHILVPALQAYMEARQIHVLELYGTADAGGEGAISAYALRQILFGLGLGWSQTDVTVLIRALDPSEDGLIAPSTMEALLRRYRRPATEATPPTAKRKQRAASASSVRRLHVPARVDALR
ncbi:hypothetical protein ACHHYP_09865 [Achlya hypogyna]|uniref:DUF4200 domain-containing protein n=1 Tax=Achlya hypogyna TaxID=1202772 RepID=A0A1V9ZIQ2_ACHHY|nr:hypothetical protein ACHHYP_09865 [Achlya hypogyna]